MGGENLRELARRVVGMDEDDVSEARQSWSKCARGLDAVVSVLTDNGPEIRGGFGTDTEVGIAAEKAFLTAAERIDLRRQEILAASLSLREVFLAMEAARTALGDAPAAPGERPEIPSTTGGDLDEDQAMKVHAAQVGIYNSRVAAYNDADADAQLKVQRLIDKYTEASAVLSGIHGDVRPPPPGEGSGGPGSGPGSRTWSSDAHWQGTGTGAVFWSGSDGSGADGNDDHTDVTEPVRPPILEPVLEGPFPEPEWSVTGPQGPGPSGVGPSVIGGVAAAGVFGAPGLINGVRGLLSGRTAGGGLAPQAIGTSNRTGGPGSLGRSGAGTPGSPVARGSRGGAGASRGAGTAGSPGGRGGRGGRGPAAAAGAAVGGRGSRRTGEREESDRDLFDEGEDWLDDEGHAPGVLD